MCILPCLLTSAQLTVAAAGLATLTKRNSPEVVCTQTDPPVEIKDFGRNDVSKNNMQRSNRSLKCEGSVKSLIAFWENQRFRRDSWSTPSPSHRTSRVL